MAAKSSVQSAQGCLLMLCLDARFLKAALRGTRESSVPDKIAIAMKNANIYVIHPPTRTASAVSAISLGDNKRRTVKAASTATAALDRSITSNLLCGTAIIIILRVSELTSSFTSRSQKNKHLKRFFQFVQPCHGYTLMWPTRLHMQLLM